MEEVAKQNKKCDVWVVLNGCVLDDSKFLSQHPGGELAILTFTGKDATAEFDMIHPPDVVEKYAPDAIIGVVGNGKAKKAKGAAKSALPVATDKGDLEAWGDWDDTPGVLLVNVRSYVNAYYYLILSIIYEICATIFTKSKNLVVQPPAMVGLSLCSADIHHVSYDSLFTALELNAFKLWLVRPEKKPDCCDCCDCCGCHVKGVLTRSVSKVEKDKKGEVSFMKRHNIKHVTLIRTNTYRYEIYQRNTGDKMRMAFSAKRRYQGHDVSNGETRKGDREVSV